MEQFPRFLMWIMLIAVELVALAHTGVLPAYAQGTDIRARAKLDEESCITTLRTINVAEAAYQGGDDTKGFARTLKELGPAGESLIDWVMASGEKDGYRFRLTPEHKGTNRPVKHYTITARPIRRLVKNQRSFFTDETHVIRFTTENRPATASDPQIDSASAK